MKKLDEYLKIGQSAKLLGISENTLRKYADEERIPVRVNAANGYRLFLREDLERFLRDTARPVKRKAK